MNPVQSKISKQTFPVTGMTCAACASSVETILLHTDGIHSAAVNYASSSVAVSWDERISAQGINQALQEVGYGLVISNK